MIITFLLFRKTRLMQSTFNISSKSIGAPDSVNDIVLEMMFLTVTASN